MVDQCGNCTFYASTAQVCRCFAPRAVYSQLQTFPHLEPEDWCGDYSTATTNVGSCSVCFFYNSTIRVCRFNAPFSAEQPEVFAYVAPEQWCGNYSTLPKPGPGGGEASAAYELASQALATARNAWVIGNQALGTASSAWIVANQALATAQNARLVADQALSTAQAARLVADQALATASVAHIKLATFGDIWATCAATTTCTAETGNITTYTVNLARYYRSGKIVHFSADINLNDNGTGGGSLRVSLPVASGSQGSSVGAGTRSSDNAMLKAYVSGITSYCTIRLYDGNYPASTGVTIGFSVAYQIN